MSEVIHWPELPCVLARSHTHVVGYREGIREIDIVVYDDEDTSASNGWGDTIEVTHHSGPHQAVVITRHLDA